MRESKLTTLENDQMVRKGIHRWIAGRVPSLMWRASGNRPRPAIIYMSGGGGRKEDVPPWVVDRAAAAGVTVLSIDLPHHGERLPPNWTPPTRVTVQDFLAMVAQTVEDLRAATAFLRNEPAVGDSPIGIRAISLSASCALAAIAAGVEVQACLSICGAADFARATAYRMQREGLPVAEIEHDVREIASCPSQLDPMRNISALTRCSLMMIHGYHDQSVPLESARALYDALTPYCIDHPDDCVFLTHAGKHGIRQPIEEIGWSWLIAQVQHGREG